MLFVSLTRACGPHPRKTCSTKIHLLIAHSDKVTTRLELAERRRDFAESPQEPKANHDETMGSCAGLVRTEANDGHRAVVVVALNCFARGVEGENLSRALRLELTVGGLSSNALLRKLHSAVLK